MSVQADVLIQSKFALDTGADEYQSPANTRTIIDKFTATNDDSGAVTLTIYIVPSGGAPSAANCIIKAESLTAGDTRDFTELQNQVLAAGDIIRVVAGSAGKVCVRASGRRVT